MANSLSKFIHPLLRYIAVLLLSAPIVILLLSVQTGPTVISSQPISNEEISRIELMLVESAPQPPFTTGLQELQLDSDDLNLLLRYAVEITNLSPQWAASLSVQKDTLSTQLSVRLADGFIPLFLNIQTRFITRGELLALDSLRFGKLEVPDRFLQYTLQKLRSNLQSSNSNYQDFTELLSSVERVQVSDDGMNITLRWDSALIDRISNQAQQLFISEQDRMRIMSYYRQITELAATIPTDLRAVSLNSFLVPMFTAAFEKSSRGGDPIAENRALFQTLAIYVNQESIDQLLGAELAAQLAPARFVEVRLQRRQDLAQHLVSIAAITASAGADLANMLSTTKEAYDARYRSGFSFSDLTANSVGVTMASLATANATQALLLQQGMIKLQSESDYMPEVGNNRDGLSETDFSTLYQNRNSPVYQRRLEEIQELINARPLFMGLRQ